MHSSPHPRSRRACRNLASIWSAASVTTLVIWRMPGGKCKLFFSTKLSMTGEEVLKTYRTRFQIEFCYRDSKQFTGLMDCQARHKSQLDFAFNASFASLNAAKVFIKDNGMDNSMAKVKSLMFNANYTKLIFDMSRCDRTEL